MGQFFEYIKIAYKSIVSNKGRTFLTMLGIIIGIASVIMISGLGSGVKNTVENELGSMFKGQTKLYSYLDEGITIEDIEYIRESVPELIMCTMETSVYGLGESVKGEFDVQCTLANETYEYSSVEGLLHGRYFDENDVLNGSMVCVIDEDSALNFFGNTDVVGQTIEFDSVTGGFLSYEIIGVRKRKESALMNLMNIFNGKMVAIEAPYTSYSKATGDTTIEDGYLYSILISAEANDANDAIRRCVSILEARHDARGEDAFGVDSFDNQTEMINKVVGYVTAFIAFVSAISLVVGGVGVMNIMLVSVTERTQEIGIRKALGARTGSIMTQFLAEASMITLVGGIMGVILGYAGAELLCSVVGSVVDISVHVSVSPGIVIGSSLFSAAIGLGFGIFPARKAAKLSPIEALRQE